MTVVCYNATRSHLRCLQGFITKRDVELVRRSTKGLGTNEARLIGTLCNRTKKQLDAVDALYHKTVGRRQIGCCEVKWIPLTITMTSSVCCRFVLLGDVYRSF